jgi:hypothetical protein
MVYAAENSQVRLGKNCKSPSTEGGKVMENIKRIWIKRFVPVFLVTFVFAFIATASQAAEYTPVAGATYDLNTGASVTFNMKDHADLDIQIQTATRGVKCKVEFWGTDSTNKTLNFVKNYKTILYYDMRPSSNWQRTKCKGTKCPKIMFKCIDGSAIIKIKGVMPE